MAFEKITEQTSRYRHLEQMTIEEILIDINKEDKTVPAARKSHSPDRKSGFCNKR